MKFGEKLEKLKIPEWDEYYIKYSMLGDIITQLESNNRTEIDVEERITSLTTQSPIRTNNGSVTQETFYSAIEKEMAKIDRFTYEKVSTIRQKLQKIDKRLEHMNNVKEVEDDLRIEVNAIAEDFLQLEKYVNLNFTGFHKILKKHDKRLSNQCKAFYMSRLHEQSWVAGDYSDILVTMSKVHGILRGDELGVKKDDDKQDFCRTTTKYWVHMEDISRVKYIVLQHLPVFLQSEMGGETDSQLVNSVYLDNAAMELYRGRMDKTPGAIALRMRWYGTVVPKTVFVERKTHKESWAGEVSVKERFIIPEHEVKSVLDGTFDIAAEEQKMRAKGKKEESIQAWKELASEITQIIGAKQLVPTMRTQYMRTAFQIPFDATVRVSLDTNLCMINEVTPESASGERWYRDPRIPLKNTEITRFPHAVLEIKLQLEEGNAAPDWVTGLINSGMLMQVHKFSKFIHGCAVLIPEDVTTVPYWIDDPTLSLSIVQSGASELLTEPHDGLAGKEFYQHMLPHDQFGNIKNRNAQNAQTGYKESLSLSLPSLIHSNTSLTFPQAASGNIDEGVCTQLCGGSHWLNCCDFGNTVTFDGKNMVPQKIEPKLILANERTFIKWLHMAVILSAISTGVLAFSPTTGEAQYFAVAMLPVALMMIGYALWTYIWRSNLIKTRAAMRWDDPLGPVILTSVLVLVLSIQFCLKLLEYLYPPQF